MLPATNRGAGMNIGFPDVCLTPAGPVVVPIPYPNFGMTAMAAVFSPVVKVSGVPALNLASTIAMTMGDEGGVAHWSIKGMGRYIMGNPIVFIDRMPAINLVCPTMGNMGNNPIGAVLVPSAVNVFYTYADGPTANEEHPSDVSMETALAMGETMLGRGAEPIQHEILEGGVGLVRVSLVTTDIARRFFVSAQELLAAGAKAIVIDLSGCRGGDLDGLVAWAASFLDVGSEIVRLIDAEGDEVIRRAALPATYTMKLVVLVDEGTASAAELFAACMKAHGRALVMGRRTYGKGTAQSLFRGETGGLAYETVLSCHGPGGFAVQGVGVLPDRVLEGDPGPAWLWAASEHLV